MSGNGDKIKRHEDQGMVWKSNALIEASYRLSVAEQRIMLACISQVNRSQPVTDEILYSVSASDIAHLTGTTTHTTYEELKKAALRLKRREVWITEKPNGEGGHDEVLITNWVQSIRYIKSQGRVELRFSRDMLPYLSQFAQQFTTYALTDIAKMTSAHAIRLYELLMQWQSKNVRLIAIDDLRNWLQLEDKYPLMADLRRWVIEPSVQQINEHSPLNVLWEQRKTGRRVTHLIFNFKTKKASAKSVKSVQPNLRAIPEIATPSTGRAGRTESAKQLAASAIEQMKLSLQ